MPKLKKLSGKEVCKILEKHGFKKVRQKGSHVIMQKGSNPTTTVPVPMHKELASGTLRSIIRQSSISKSEFEG